ncbi:MAG: membrane protein insertase YidC [Chitinophagales bacterium]
MKNSSTLVGTLLMGLLMFGFFYMNNQQQPPKPAAKQAAADTTAAANAATAAQPDTAIAEVTPPTPAANTLFEQATTANERSIVLENDKMKVVVNTRGGVVSQVELKDYKTWDKKPLILFNEKSQQLNYQFVGANSQIVNTGSQFFEPVSSGNASVSMRMKSGEGYFEQKYTLHPNSYVVDYEVNVVGLEKVIPANINDIQVNWQSRLLNLEQAVQTERRYSALYYKYKDSEVAHLDEDKDDVNETFLNAVDWVSFKQEFFNATLFSNGLFRGKVAATFKKDDKDYVKNYNATLILPYRSGAANNYAMKWYFGPNHYSTLKATSEGFENIIKLSPDNFVFNWIKYITKFLTIPTFNILDKTGMNYGIIILILTILLKLVLTPLTWKAIKSGAYMKVLKPEIDALKEKYGDDQAKIGAEQMRIYNSAGVSPLGGCLPMLLQLPILMSMYYFFPTSIELRQQPFLWAHDLSTYDAIISFKNAIPLFGNHISLFTILMTVTSIIFAVYNQAQSGMSSTQPGMQYMPYIMPVMMMFMFNDLPAALTFYYLVQNVISTAQQWIMQNFFINEDEVRKRIESNKKNPVKKSGWMKKLEDLQRQAEQQQRERQRK